LPIVSVHHELVGSGDVLHPVFMIKLLRNVLTELIACSTVRDSPANVILRIRPKEITHWPFMRDLLHSVKQVDLVNLI